MEGTYEAAIQDYYCARAENGVCQEWKTESTSCSGKLPRLLTCIDAITRK